MKTHFIYVTPIYSKIKIPKRIFIGQLRRLADEFGYPGIVAKGEQSNIKVLKNGFLKTRWEKKSQAVAYRRLVRLVWDGFVRTRHTSIRKQ